MFLMASLIPLSFEISQKFSILWINHKQRKWQTQFYDSIVNKLWLSENENGVFWKRYDQSSFEICIVHA